MPKIIENPQAIILEHANKILGAEGYGALNMRAIAKSCGIATGTIYNYFPTKRHLLLQMMTDYWDTHFATIDKITASDEKLFAKLKKVFDVMEAFALCFRDVWVSMRSESEPICTHEHIPPGHDYLQRLAEKVELILIIESNRDPANLNYPLPARDMANFIVQNYFIICQMRSLPYSSLEVLLEKVLQ